MGSYCTEKQLGRYLQRYLKLNFPALIADALECYMTDKDMKVEQDTAVAFVREVNGMFRKYQ